jgi:pyrroloquinoline quinone biosynthesis protein E
MNNAGSNLPEHQPFWLLAELTYACPLQCPYCSNPVNYSQARKHELNTEQWISVLEQGRRLGAVQLGLSGGEPCVRQDLESIVRAAREMGYYTNLLTSTVGLNQPRIEHLQQAGLDHIQVSLQGVDQRSSKLFSGSDHFDHKIEMAQAIRQAGIPMVLNFVVHRHNIDQIETVLELALQLQAEAVELANCQYIGWAMQNIAALLPNRAQLKQAEQIVEQFRKRNPKAMPVLFVVPDLYEGRPRPCVNGWGTTLLSVTPEGNVLPCQGAASLPNVILPNVKQTDLQTIWQSDPLFERFRGLDWLPEPCRSCDEKSQDFGGCRCQAFAMTGDETATDPVCNKSPNHQNVIRLVNEACTQPSNDIIMRTPQKRKQSITTH